MGSRPELPATKAIRELVPICTALGGVAADAVASGSRLDDLHGAAAAGMGAVLHGGPQCGE